MKAFDSYFDEVKVYRGFKNLILIFLNTNTPKSN
jgi:hypothetical protein